MDQRSWVTALYILGAALTIAGAFAAYWRAQKQKKVLDELSADNQSIPEVDFVKTFERAREGGLIDQQAERQRVADEQRLEEKLREADLPGVRTWNDMRLPSEYFARRSAVADVISSFRTGGLVALVGVLSSTVASVWSLYLPS